MVVVITGASAGIGRALAEELSASGARLVLAARRMERLEALNQSLGGGHLCVPTDVAEPHQCEALVRRASEHFGRIDTLICNAGYGLLATIADTSVEQWRDIIRTNLSGTIDCIRPAVPLMRSQTSSDGPDGWRGQIVIVTSAIARRGLPYFGAYAATKAAQLSLAEAMRVELRADRVAVTTVHPIGTDSDFWDVSARLSAGLRPDNRREIHQSPETVARATVRAIRRPRAEVWPFPLARWGLSFATLVPGVVDRVVAKRKVIERR